MWKDDSERFTVAWQEQGGPVVAPPTAGGFGMKMLERALTSDLQGKIALSFAPTGLICVIDAPREGNLL